MRHTARRFGSLTIDPLANEPLPESREQLEAALAHVTEKLRLIGDSRERLNAQREAQGQPLFQPTLREAVLATKLIRLRTALDRIEKDGQAAADAAHTLAVETTPA